MGIYTQIVEAAHAYTHTDIPWEEASRGVMRAHGMSVGEERAARCRRRFALVAALLAAGWCWGYFG